MSSFAELRARYDAAGQGHVFRYLDAAHADKSADSDEIAAQIAAFIVQLEGIDIDLVNKLYSATMAAAAESPGGVEELAPATGVTSLFSGDNTAGETPADAPKLRHEMYNHGLDMICRGEVGVLILGGGQGTRLGYDRPKGEYDIGLCSHKSLFQLQVERLIRVKELAAAHGGVEVDAISLPLYVMTSPMTDEDTRKYFEQHAFFGMPSNDVVFFCQGTLPSLSNEGKVLLDSRFHVAENPDGNGGIYRALHTQGIITHMQTRGVKGVHVFAVDNAIVKVADPGFVGFCDARKADVGSKVCAKTGPHEKVGVLCKRGGRYNVVEYSEMDKATAEERDERGKLLFNAGNLCIHYYTVDFLAKECNPSTLPKVYHIARKAIPIVDDTTGLTITKEKLATLGNTGMKLESFIFDVFPQSEHMAILDVARESEFSPVKNAPGSKDDSPDTARSLLCNEHRRWLTAAGVDICGDGQVEVSPRVSYSGEGLDKLSGMKVSTPVLFVSRREVQSPAAVDTHVLVSAASKLVAGEAGKPLLNVVVVDC